jgi:hypothetical protein
MDRRIVEDALRMHVGEMRERLERAAGIAKVAETCADGGNLEKAIEIALDIEPLIYEVSTLLNAASLMHHLDRS